MNYFEEQEQAISENVYRQLMKMMEVVPEDRRDGLYMYVHLDKEVGIKISCNLLLDNKTEANILAQNLNKQTLEEFKKYPIAIYL